MNDDIFKKNLMDKRREPRTIADRYSSVEFSLSNSAPDYQFKIWGTSHTGMNILVKEDSLVLDHLKVGDILEMKYNPPDPTEPAKFLKTEIKHITKDEQGRFKGNYMIGLSILKTLKAKR
ncbi:MAG: hypothetical protein SV375_03580 [Thermodesulfobacteriota bacterium]|nr:hypothetical protein [Thermodesulfobacteriota bacterium]